MIQTNAVDHQQFYHKIETIVALIVTLATTDDDRCLPLICGNQTGTVLDIFGVYDKKNMK